MKFKGFITVVFLLVLIQIHANQFENFQDLTKTSPQNVTDTDSLLNLLMIKIEKLQKPNHTSIKQDSLQISEKSTSKSFDNKLEKAAFEDSVSTIKSAVFTLPANLVPIQIDSLLLNGNPFFIELVYMGLPPKPNWAFNPDFRVLYYGKPVITLNKSSINSVKKRNDDELIADLRTDALNEITRKATNLYIMTFDQLPDPKGYRNYFIPEKPLENVQFVDENQPNYFRNKKIFVKREQLGPWFHKASALAQFSENTVTSNWYQGGNNNIAILGILSGQLNYDDKKCIQWENSGEWRMGFNSVQGDTLRLLSTNEDILRITSKLGIKAGGNFFYSGLVDFSTQFFNSYNGINSTVLKTSFLTPVRLNIGVGLDYKYKKVFSLMFSPISYKYIYVYNVLSSNQNPNQNPNPNPNLFGIQTGENHLSEIGSSFKATFSYPVTPEIQLDSKLSFYTNYKKVEIDWEIICNMTINRFMSTRISINPRYDNTVIMATGDKAQIQFKQLVSVGFSHKF
jgi:hypothetical protein